jgi:hypothetical protein
MTDRDFKLLVREYFQRKDFAKDVASTLANKLMMEKVEKRILSELEQFSKQEQEELPFSE